MSIRKLLESIDAIADGHQITKPKSKNKFLGKPFKRDESSIEETDDEDTDEKEDKITESFKAQFEDYVKNKAVPDAKKSFKIVGKDGAFSVKNEKGVTVKSGSKSECQSFVSKKNAELNDAKLDETRADPGGKWIVYRSAKDFKVFTTYKGACTFQNKWGNGYKVASAEWFYDKVAKAPIKEGYWDLAMQKFDKEQAARKASFAKDPNFDKDNKNPASHDKNGVYKGDKDLAGKPVAKPVNEAQKDTIEAHGIRGMQRKPWRRSFKNADAMIAWCEKYDAEIYGTRDTDYAEQNKQAPVNDVSEDVDGEWPNNERGRAHQYFQDNADADMDYEDIVAMMIDAGFTEEAANDVALDSGRVQTEGIGDMFNKHSFLGKIKRHHELKGKVDSTWADAVNAEKNGDKKGATKSFLKHVRYTNLERPGTWTNVKEDNINNEPNTDSILECLTSAYRHIRKFADSYQDFSTITRVYENVRSELMAGNFSGFEQEYDNCLRRYPDAATELFDAMFVEAGLPEEQGTYEQFMAKMSESAMGNTAAPVTEGFAMDDIAIGGTVIYKSLDGHFKMSKVRAKGPGLSLQLMNGSRIQNAAVVSTDQSDWAQYRNTVKEAMEVRAKPSPDKLAKMRDLLDKLSTQLKQTRKHIGSKKVVDEAPLDQEVAPAAASTIVQAAPGVTQAAANAQQAPTTQTGAQPANQAQQLKPAPGQPQVPAQQAPAQPGQKTVAPAPGQPAAPVAGQAGGAPVAAPPGTPAPAVGSAVNAATTPANQVKGLVQTLASNPAGAKQLGTQLNNVIK